VKIMMSGSGTLKDRKHTGGVPKVGPLSGSSDPGGKEYEENRYTVSYVLAERIFDQNPKGKLWGESVKGIICRERKRLRSSKRDPTRLEIEKD